MALSLTAKKTQLSTQWRRWAEAIADGGDTPTAIEIVEAGAMLSIDKPIDALQADASAIVQVRLLEAQAAKIHAAVAARLAPYGGQAGLRARVAELKAELRRLEPQVGIAPEFIRAGQFAGDAGRIRQAHPRAFAVETKSKKATKKGAK